jgi:hypothetical protein
MNVSFRSEKRLQQVNQRDQKILRTLSDTMEVTHESQEWVPPCMAAENLKGLKEWKEFMKN